MTLPSVATLASASLRGQIARRRDSQCHHRPPRMRNAALSCLGKSVLFGTRTALGQPRVSRAVAARLHDEAERSPRPAKMCALRPAAIAGATAPNHRSARARDLSSPTLAARKAKLMQLRWPLERERMMVLGRSERCKLTYALLWECSYKRQQLAELLGQLRVFLTLARGDRDDRCVDVAEVC
jgi:hypothetical protein